MMRGRYFDTRSGVALSHYIEKSFEQIEQKQE